MNSLQMAAVVFASAGGSALLVLTHRFHVRWTGDHAGGGKQKHHEGSPTRVAALPLLLAVGLGCWLLLESNRFALQDAGRLMAWLVVASLPAVLVGLADDFVKGVPPRVRLVGAALASLLAMALLDARITRVDIPALDLLLAWAPASVLLTVLMVCGFTNAMNIVDGLNGLSAGLALLMSLATGWLAWRVGDAQLVQMCVLMGCALLGFLVLNFPRGALFLGDGGAYFIGFALAQIWILLVQRNPDVSPWLVLAIGFHPTMETMFSIVRRRWLHRRKGAATLADRLHLHSLAYRRGTLQWLAPMRWPRWVANASAAVLIVVFASVPMALVAVGPASAGFGMAVLALGVLGYLWWFKRLVRFSSRLPGWPVKPKPLSGTAGVKAP